MLLLVCERPELNDYLANFTGLDPLNAITCPLVQSSGGGLGLGLPLATLLIMGPIGLALSIRAQHPGPIVVTSILVIGSVAATLPGIAAQIMAIVLFVSIAGAGIYIYRRAQQTL